MSAVGSRFLMLAGSPESLVNFRGSLLLMLVSLGLEVHVASPGLLANSVVSKKLREIGVFCHDFPLSRTGLNPVSDWNSYRVLRRLIRDLRPDAVFAYTIKPVIYGLLAARSGGVAKCYALITGLGYAFTGSVTGKRALIQWVARKLYRHSLRSAKVVFFQNPDDQQVFRARGILSPNSSSVVVNGSGVDLDKFIFISPLKVKPVFLLIARLIGDKGIREFVQAAQLIQRSYPDCRFLLVGGLDSNPDAISQIELDDWIHNGMVEYLGRLDDVRPAIARASVYVLPSYREGTPRSVLEAMAMGRAIITTNAPGCRETVIDGENGFLVPVKSVDALVEAMTRFIEDPDLAVRMGKRSREIAEEKYDVHKVNAVMLKEMGIQ